MRIFLITSLLFFSQNFYAQSGICFAPSFTSNAMLGNMCMADFNNDNKADIAGSGISVLFGTGVGNFTLSGTYSTYTVGSSGSFLCSGDFNNDGWKDLAAGNHNSSVPDVSVLLNNGNGTFAQAVGYTVGSSTVINGPDGIVSADINSDGNMDLFVSGGTEIYTMLGTGTGSFTFNSASIISNVGMNQGGNTTGCIASGNFNSDAYADFAYVTSSSVAVVFGTSSGTVTTPVYYPGSVQFALADFNSDGRVDIGTATCILLGSSSGTFAVSTTYSVAANPLTVWGVAAGNFDADNFPDLVVQSSSVLYYLHGAGNGQISNISQANIPTGLCTLKAADLNGDLKTDVLTAGNPYLTYSVTTLINQSFPVSAFAAPSQICSGSSSTLTISGTAVSYTWNSGSTLSSISVTPSLSTIYSVAITGTNGCFVTHTVAVSINSPTLQITASPSVVCPNAGSSLSVSGANSYTWSGGPVNLPYNVTPSVSSVYMVTGTSSLGCIAIATVQISTYTPPLITVQSPSLLCAGSSATLSGSGAITYTWQPLFALAPQIIVTPTSNICYTLIGSSSQNCTASAVACMSLAPLPIITVSGSGTMCAGALQTLTASGAVSYTWNGGPATAQMTISPLANTCYSVIGTDNNSCQSFTSFCISAITSTAGISPLQQTVCAGSSANFTASSASSYSWSTGSNSNTLNLLSISNTVVTLSLTASNGCTAATTASLSVDPLCSMVWPGDANSDGTVNGSDILELGLQFSNSGASRINASISYSAQYCTAWTGSVSTGANTNHADCDGNGTVGLSDTLAVYNNFSLSHAFKNSAATSVGFIFGQDTVQALKAGKWNSLHVLLGSSSNLAQIYGASFDLNFNKDLIEPDSINLSYPSSFINTGNQNIEFRKFNYSNGRIHCATVRTDKNDASGLGMIAVFSFKLRADIPDGTKTIFTLNNETSINASGNPLNMYGSSVELEIVQNLTALEELWQIPLSIYPNPVSDLIQVITPVGTFKYTLTDLSGRLILKGDHSGNQTIDVSILNKGTYLFTISNGKVESRKLLLITK